MNQKYKYQQIHVKLEMARKIRRKIRLYAWYNRNIYCIKNTIYLQIIFHSFFVINYICF